MNHKKLDKSISRSIYRALKRQREGFIWETTTGLTFSVLKDHLESQFTDEMNWDNYGSYWVLDKIIPTSFFRYSDRVNNEFQKAWSLKNMRPLERIEHNRRGKHIDMDLVEEYSLFDILPIGKII